MERYLHFRDPQYFESNEQALFVFETIGGIIKLANLFKFRGSHYFAYTGMEIKATTTKCCLLSDFSRQRVHYNGHPQLTGTIMGHTGVSETPFAYVFWDGGKGIKIPYAPALINLNDLVFL